MLALTVPVSSIPVTRNLLINGGEKSRDAIRSNFVTKYRKIADESFIGTMLNDNKTQIIINDAFGVALLLGRKISKFLMGTDGSQGNDVSSRVVDGLISKTDLATYCLGRNYGCSKMTSA